MASPCLVRLRKNHNATMMDMAIAVTPISCRLITRVRMKYSWLSWAAPFNVLVEFFDLPMMRKCLYGIKRRAEALTTASWPKN